MAIPNAKHELLLVKDRRECGDGRGQADPGACNRVSRHGPRPASSHLPTRPRPTTTFKSLASLLAAYCSLLLLCKTSTRSTYPPFLPHYLPLARRGYRALSVPSQRVDIPPTTPPHRHGDSTQPFQDSLATRPGRPYPQSHQHAFETNKDLYLVSSRSSQ
jgi:hypothetical protein